MLSRRKGHEIKSTTKITKENILYKPLKIMLLTVTKKADSMEYFEAQKDQKFAYFSMYYNTHIDEMKAFSVNIM